jgi:UDP-N-acetylmuramyl pentapeptide phosphotransferase/UDP-N-acetylglucosamine-1-phosphate transferase
MVLAVVAACLIGAGAGHFRVPAVPWQTWLAGAGFLLVGTLDDRFSFRPRHKFFVLLAFSMLAAWPWVLRLQAPGFAGVLVGPWTLRPGKAPAGILLTLWFMALPNAANIEDAINGYIGGFTLILLGVLAWNGLSTWTMLGALAGFIILNWPRAIHFMGDCGSLGCGFLLAEGLLRGGGLQRPVYALILTAPVSLDVAMGILRRCRLGMGLFEPDRGTLPHHLLTFFQGSTTLAAGLLWANALAFVLLAPFPLVAAFYTVLFLGVLVLFNRESLFKQWSAP